MIQAKTPAHCLWRQATVRQPFHDGDTTQSRGNVWSLPGEDVVETTINSTPLKIARDSVKMYDFHL